MVKYLEQARASTTPTSCRWVTTFDNHPRRSSNAVYVWDSRRQIQTSDFFAFIAQQVDLWTQEEGFILRYGGETAEIQGGWEASC